jgi:phosphoribosyl-dephospho-CoA transferase
MMTVKLSAKPCLFCGKSAGTLQAKSKEHDFQGVVCGDHMMALLKKWDEHQPEPSAKQPAAEK